MLIKFFFISGGPFKEIKMDIHFRCFGGESIFIAIQAKLLFPLFLIPSTELIDQIKKTYVSNNKPASMVVHLIISLLRCPAYTY